MQNNITTYYFLGIGGIGMSALARYFNAKGFRVMGYDRTRTPLTEQLEREGIDIHYTASPNPSEGGELFLPFGEVRRGCSSEGLTPQNTIVVFTPAVPSDFEEFQYFKNNGFTMLKRAQVLGEITRNSKGICIAGTHGKTTTSTMTAHLLYSSAVGCSAFLGGVSKNYDTNLLIAPPPLTPPKEGDSSSPSGRLGGAVVIEADEYDRSFHHLTPYMALITAADADHLDIYGNKDEVRRSFEKFASLVQPNGFLVVNEKIAPPITAPPSPPKGGGEQSPSEGGIGEGFGYLTANVATYELLKEFAQNMRKFSTEAESALWQMLRRKNLDVRFRRQHIIGDFIVDFVCLKGKLIIEVDGGYHNEPDAAEYDTIRTQMLNDRGFNIIRFTNEEVLVEPDSVLERINNALNQTSPPSGGLGGAFTYGMNSGDFHAENIKIENGEIIFDFVTPNETITNIQLGVPVLINVENAVGAMALARLAGVTPDELRSGMASFKGIKRRFDIQVKTDTIVYIDDYAHHPEELKASISSIKTLYPNRKVCGIFQPHLYSRTRDFQKEFGASLSLLDELILLDIYAARELPIEGITSDVIFKNVTIEHKIQAKKEEVLEILRNKLQNDEIDVLLTFGAGDIDQLVKPITNLIIE